MKRKKEGKIKKEISFLKQEDFVILEKIRSLLLPIKEKYGFDFDELKELLKEIFFPLEIFNKKLTALESIVKYLKEEKKAFFK